MRLTPLFIMFLVVVHGSAMAQQSLSLSEAAEMAFASNHAIKAAEYHALAAKRSKQATKGLFAPQINIRSAWVHAQRDIGVDFNPLKNLLGTLDIAPLLGLDWSYTIQSRNFGFIEADITVPIFTGGKIIAASRAATLAEQVAISESKAQKEATLTELISRYFGLSLAKSIVALREQVVEGMQRHLSDITALKQNGMATVADSLYIQYRLAKAEQQASEARATLQTAHSALCTTAGCDSIATLTTPIFYLATIEPLNHFIDTAEQLNPQLEQVAHQKELARQNIAIHRADFMPQIAAMGGGAFTRRVTDLLPRWAVGVGVNFKIFDGLRKEYQYFAAKSTYNRVEQLELEAKGDISLLVTSLYNQASAALERVFALQKSIDFAKEYLLLKQSAFYEGAATSTAVIDATIELAAAQIEQLQSAYSFDIALAQLLEAAGAGEQYFRYSDSYNKQPISYEAK
ncbi:MAG: TolC family protein [Alistipes sp.]|nr:TolC family protein [Alistipes sp.]